MATLGKPTKPFLAVGAVSGSFIGCTVEWKCEFIEADGGTKYGIPPQTVQADNAIVVCPEPDLCEKYHVRASPGVLTLTPVIKFDSGNVPSGCGPVSVALSGGGVAWQGTIDCTSIAGYSWEFSKDLTELLYVEVEKQTNVTTTYTKYASDMAGGESSNFRELISRLVSSMPSLGAATSVTFVDDIITLVWVSEAIEGLVFRFGLPQEPLDFVVIEDACDGSGGSGGFG